MVRRRAHRWFASALLIGVIVTFVYLVIMVIDYRLPYINPPDTLTVIRLHLGVYYEQERYLSEPSDAEVGVFLRCEGPLIAGKEIMMDGLAIVSADIANEPVLEIRVLFPTSHAYPPSNNSNGMPIDANLSLHRVNGTHSFTGTPVSIYWPVPGDFPPVIRSITAHRTTENVFLYSSIHVEPESAAISEKSSRVERALTLALTYFAFIEAISIYLEYREEPARKKSQQPPQETQPTSQTS